MPIWIWNPDIGKFVDDISFEPMGFLQAMMFVEDSLISSQMAVTSFAELLADGVIDPDKWYLMMAQELKEEYIRQYLLGIGGRNNMTFKDWGSIGGMLADQYRYLKDFRDEIKGLLDAGETLSPDAIAARARMYSNSAREAFNRAQERVVTRLGYDEEMWITTASESCPDCIAYDKMGWQPIGTFPIPGDGSTICLTNCKCFKQYQKSKTGQIFQDDVQAVLDMLERSFDFEKLSPDQKRELVDLMMKPIQHKITVT